MSVTDKVNELSKKVVVLSGVGAADTLKANALESDVLKGKTFFARGIEYTGNIETYKGEVVKQ